MRYEVIFGENGDCLVLIPPIDAIGCARTFATARLMENRIEISVGAKRFHLDGPPDTLVETIREQGYVRVCEVAPDTGKPLHAYHPRVLDS